MIDILKNPFKVGNTVKCINKEYNIHSELVIGKKYRIFEIESDIIIIEGSTGRWTHTQFEKSNDEWDE